MRRPWPELALLGVAAAFALTFAGESIWLDEAFSVQVAESPWARFWELLRNDNGPPLYYALLKGWIEVFGDGERALRALSALMAVAAVVPAIGLGREVGGGSRASGLAAGLLFACSAQVALHARAARMYALVLLLAAMATWLWSRWLGGRGTKLTLSAFALTTALGAYTHYWFAFLTLAQLAGAGAILRRKALPLLVAALAGWAPFLAWAPTLSAQLQNGSRSWIPPVTPWAPFEALAGVLGRPSTFALTALIAVLAWRQRPRPEPAWNAAAILVATALLVPFALSLGHPIFWPVRHAAIAVPAVAALLGAPLAQLLQPRALALVLASLLALRGVTHAAEAQAAESREKTGSDRAAAAYLAAHAAPGDAVIFVGLSGPALRYYLRRAPIEPRAFPTEMDQHPAWIDPASLSPSSLEQEAAALDQSLHARPVWLVSVEGDPIADHLRARLVTRPRDASARLDGLFYDRIERFLATPP
jgi:4-amino-4-deoxy-L-arabinose transferase-like glycosyltransferase